VDGAASPQTNSYGHRRCAACRESVPQVNEPRELSLLSTASQALCEARTVDEVKDIRDKAEAVRAYARKAKLGQSILLEASLVKVRAERKLGCILAETELAKASMGNQFTGPRVQEADMTPTLETLGITKSDSSRLQQIATLPEEMFQNYIVESVEAEKEPSTAGLLRLAKRQRAAVDDGNPRSEPNAESDDGNAVAATPMTFDELVASGVCYSTILAAPRCLQRDHSAAPSPLMNIDEICAMPVVKIAHDTSCLHLWTRPDLLLDALDVIEAWGFEYRSSFVWIEPTDELPCRYWRDTCRILLLGTRGGMPFQDVQVPGHLKPSRQQLVERSATVRRLVERVSPGPYLELFATDVAEGWTTHVD